MKLTESRRVSPSPATAVAQSRKHRSNVVNSPVGEKFLEFREIFIESGRQKFDVLWENYYFLP